MGLVPLQGLLSSAFAQMRFEPKFSAAWEVDFPLASLLDIVIGLFVTASRGASSRGIPPRVPHTAVSSHRGGGRWRHDARRVCPEGRVVGLFAAPSSPAAPEEAATSGGGMAMKTHLPSWGF
jgi:hypothetical protein